MIIPEIRNISCSDLEPGVEPSDPTDVYLELSTTIGMPGEVRADYYGFIFITPKSLKRLSSDVKRRINPCKVVDIFRWDEAERYIREKCEACADYDWVSVCNHLRKWSHWEYEGFR